ncbi:MAG: hypothetical protein M1818_005144 [Claussenomyces sp. TS43310]|nr:MAG: hypothetical protein M1818_005144 [Claussenomyces sp. TS43310]
MPSFAPLVALAFCLSSPVFAYANPALLPRQTTTSATESSTVFSDWNALKTPSGGALQLATEAPPLPTSGAVAQGAQDAGASVTVNIVNSWSVPVSITCNQNPGPSPTIFPGGVVANQTSYVFPTGWAGMMAIGKTLDVRGSKIEVSFVNAVDVDISYVDGYSLPITCSCNGGDVIAGCNKPLFSLNDCADEDLDGPVCINTAPNAGPALPFFAPCQGLAYTYPYDDTANYGNGKCPSNIIDCCVGPSCPASSLQTKRNDDSPVVRRHAWPRKALDPNAF